jgi:hypothetical protein
VYLTHQRGMFLRMAAMDTYMLAVEDGQIPCLSTECRLRFVEKLVTAAALAASDKASDKKPERVSEDYRKCVDAFLRSEENVRKLWVKFELAEAEAGGSLSPQKIVKDILQDRQLSYGQTSTLESYAARAIAAAKAKGYSLPKIVRSARSAVTCSSAYRQLKPMEVAHS